MKLGLSRFDLIGSVLLAGITVVAFWKPIHYPFIEDDWYLIELFSVRFADFDEWLFFYDQFYPQEDSLFYRPLSYNLILLLERAFGLNELGFHAIHVALSFGAALAVVGIAHRLTGNRQVAWLAGALTAGAVVVRLFPSLWMVGSFDIAAVFFFLLSLLCFVRKRVVLAAGLFLFALLFKEAAAPLVLIVAAYHLLYRSPAGGAVVRVKAFAREVGPFLVIFGLWLIPKLQGISPFSVPPDHPYRVELNAGTLFRNLEYYLGWSGRALIPSDDLGHDIANGASFSGLELGAAAAVVATLALVAALYGGSRRSRVPADSGGPIGRREVVFLTCWFLAAIAPALFLTNHRNAYYLIYSLPAFQILAVGGFATILRALAPGRRIVAGAVGLCAAVGLIANLVQTYTLERAVRRTPVSQLVGQGLLPFALGSTTDRVTQALEREVPSVTGKAVFVFSSVEGAAVGWSAGLRVIYANPEITALPATALAEEAPEGAGPIFVLRPHPERPVDVQVLRPADLAAAEALIG